MFDNYRKSVYSNEYQKGQLLYKHLLLFLHLKEQLCNGTQVDEIFSLKFFIAKNKLDRFLIDIVASVIVSRHYVHFILASYAYNFIPKSSIKRAAKILQVFLIKNCSF